MVVTVVVTPLQSNMSTAAGAVCKGERHSTLDTLRCYCTAMLYDL